MTLLCFVIVGKHNEPIYSCDCSLKNDNKSEETFIQEKEQQQQQQQQQQQDEKNNENNNDNATTTDEKNEEKKSDHDDDDDDDFFGFESLTSKSRRLGDSLSFQHEFMLHASLDRLEEIVGAYHLQSRRQTGSHWLGFLCPVDENSVYAYATSTNIKFLAMVSPTTGPPPMGGSSSSSTTTATTALSPSSSSAASTTTTTTTPASSNPKSPTTTTTSSSSSPQTTNTITAKNLAAAAAVKNTMFLQRTSSFLSGAGSQVNNIKVFFSKIHELYIQYTLNPFTKIQGKIQSNRFDYGVRLAIQEYYTNNTTYNT